MKTLTLILALGFAAAAQPPVQTITTQNTTSVPGITLSGPVADPIIENHTTKPIVAAVVLYFSSDGKQLQRTERMFILDRPNYLAPGDSEEVRTFDRGVTDRQEADKVASSKVTAVIFSDGEVRGEDDRSFSRGMEKRFQSMREAFHLAQSNDWDQLKALDDAGTNGDLWKSAAANRLLRTHKQGGDAVNAHKHYGNLPAYTWKGTLINKWRIPEMFQSIAAWFMPTASAARGDHIFTNSQPYDVTYYYCDDPSQDPPCPGAFGSTDWVGRKATCVAIPPAFAYPTGMKLQLAQDLRYPPGVEIQITATATSSAPYLLDSLGKCVDPRLFGYANEYAEYNKACEDVTTATPVKVVDNSQYICGASKIGYLD